MTSTTITNRKDAFALMKTPESVAYQEELSMASDDFLAAAVRLQNLVKSDPAVKCTMAFEMAKRPPNRARGPPTHEPIIQYCIQFIQY